MHLVVRNRYEITQQNLAREETYTQVLLNQKEHRYFFTVPKELPIASP